MIRVQVWMKPEAEYDRRAGQFLILETDAENFADFVRRTDENTMICGDMLITRRDFNGDLVITNRVPMAFRGETVGRCQPCTRELVEGREAA